MYEKILVPLDGSKLAEVALTSAGELAIRLGSQIILIAVTESAEAQDYHKHQIYIEKAVEETRERMEPYLGSPKEKTLRVKPVILVGHPAEETIRYANRENTSLVVMATHGSSGIRRWAMGGMADKVLRAIERPVVLVRAKTTRTGASKKGILNKAIVALDGSEEGEAVLPYITELAARLQTEVTLLQVVAKHYRVYADAEAYLEHISGLFKERGITTQSEVRMGAAAEEIIKLADETKADIVAMSTHGQSGISRWSIGSVADRVLHGGNTPVLLVRTPGAITGD